MCSPYLSVTGCRTQIGSDAVLEYLGLGVGGQDLGSTLHRGVVGDGLLELLPRGMKAVRQVCDLS